MCSCWEYTWYQEQCLSRDQFGFCLFCMHSIFEDRSSQLPIIHNCCLAVIAVNIVCKPHRCFAMFCSFPNEFIAKDLIHLIRIWPSCSLKGSRLPLWRWTRWFIGWPPPPVFHHKVSPITVFAQPYSVSQTAPAAHYNSLCVCVPSSSQVVWGVLRCLDT